MPYSWDRIIYINKYDTRDGLRIRRFSLARSCPEEDGASASGAVGKADYA